MTFIRWNNRSYPLLMAMQIVEEYIFAMKNVRVKILLKNTKHDMELFEKACINALKWYELNT